MLIKAALVDGRPEVGVLPTGQVTGVIDELPTVAELLDRIAAEATATLERLGSRTAGALTPQEPG
jgi:NAD(P)H-dependent flavin oxidoreductase YrpB (nitropropane dioxygenase family)